MNRDQFTEGLIDFIRRSFLDGDAAGELSPATPLLEWGILTSLNTTVLLSYIRETWGITVPPQHITGRNLATVDAIAGLLVSLCGACESRPGIAVNAGSKPQITTTTGSETVP
jgi:acyl carrier protein